MKELSKELHILEASLKDDVNKLENLLDKLLASRRKNILENKPVEDIEQLIEQGIKLLPTARTKQRYLPYVLKNQYSESQIEKQIDLIRFKRLLRKTTGVTVSPGGNDKLLDMEFSKALNIPTPKVLEKNIDFDRVDFTQAPFVLKPTYGANANNVYYVYSESKVIEVKSAKLLSSIEELKQKIIKTGYSRTWQTEQLMLDSKGNPSTDLKVYAYYGKIGGVMEVLRQDKTYRCWYSPQGEILESEKLKTEWFNGEGFSQRLLDYAKKISLATPVPFLRIDFYQDGDEYYLGEITPHPGKYFTEYSPEVDTFLGVCFAEAETRLFADLLKGKKFDLYFDVYKGYLK